MGGRGRSSGISDKGKKYGTEYRTLHKVGNIKFVSRVSEDSEELFETMTKGRVYAVVNSRNEVAKIVYFDSSNKRNKQIDIRHPHDGVRPHVHHGYIHNEKDTAKGYTHPTKKEKDLVDRVLIEWYKYRKDKS